MTRVYLVRHGSTEWNESRRFQGHHDVPLSALGRAQAARVAIRLSVEPIDVGYSSDLLRAHETAQIIVGERPIPIITDVRLRECCFGEWEGLRHDEIAVRDPELWEAYLGNPAENCPPGGESLNVLAERVAAGFRALAGAPITPGETEEPSGWFAAGSTSPRGVLLASHGAALGVLLRALLGFDPGRERGLPIRPASLSIVELGPHGTEALVIGDTSHLEGLEETRAAWPTRA
ncbi:MAG: hypothetical protein QOF51_4151 [Chloroflexota bacterium]|jgi:broad specificity phosphatase PhoE|nr:hypothetical protein [Chloroflexota bacterium]